MVQQSDIVYVNLIGAKRVSISCVSEIAYGYTYNKLVVIAMEEDNIHRHAFINQEAAHIFTSSEEAEAYLEKLAKGIL